MTAHKLGEYVVYVLAGLAAIIAALGFTVLSMFVIGPFITVCLILGWLVYSLYKPRENDKLDT